MSPSKIPSPKGRVIAAAAPDTEVFLIDHAFRLVERSVGRLDVTVDPGLYKIKFRRGQVTREETFALVPGEREHTVTTPPGLDVAPAMPPAAAPEALPAPEPPRAMRAATAATASTDSAISLFVSAPEGAEAAVAGLTLVDAAGHEVLDVARAGGRSSSGIAARMALPPGAYRVRLAVDALGTLEQSLVLSPGWETRLELEPTTVTARDGTSLTCPDLAQASVYMTQGSDDYSEARSYARLVRAWIAGPQATIAASHADRLLSAPIADPMFATLVAHTLVRQTESDRRRGVRESRSRRTLIKNLATALQALVPMHPDVDALSVWLGNSPVASFATPPMLWSSWSALTRASATRPGLVPAGSLSAAIAEHLWTSPVWLQWRADRIEAPAEPAAPIKRASLISEVLAHRTKGTEGASSLSDMERAVWDCMTQENLGDSLRSVGAKAVKRLGVPSATFDRVLAGLAKKLR